MNHIGVDGCTAGWVAVGRVGLALGFRVFPRISDLVSEYASAERIFIDIPIGLPWAAEPTRPCDQLARGALGKTRRCKPAHRGGRAASILASFERRPV